MSEGKLASGKNRSAKTGANLDNQITLEFDDNHLFASLCGEHDAHLARIEHQLGLQIASRGNRLAPIGPPEAVDTARTALETLWQRLKHGLEVGPTEIDAVLRSAMGNLDETARAAALRAIGAGTSVVERNKTGGRTGGKTSRGSTGALMPRSPTQARYLQAMADSALVFGVGPAGTGKTYLAVAEAVRRFLAEEVDRIIITRPAVEAGERLGFLPGDMRDKVDPYLRPIYDALFDLLGPERTAKRLETGQIEVAPLAFMRGRTLANAFVILDEAQNTTAMQMRMVLTRLGENSRMVVTGDPSQIDLPPSVRSGLLEALDILGGEEDMDIIRFAPEDVVRHALVARIVRAYERADKARKNPEGKKPDANKSDNNAE